MASAIPRPARHAFASTLKSFTTASGKVGQLYSLPALARKYPNIKRLPVSIRIVLESVLRNCDGQKVTTEHVAQLANWQPIATRTEEIPFVVARVVLQDFTGVPLLADLAAMRSTAVRLGKNPKKAKEISTITDPAKFAFAVAQLETQLKVTQRKAATAPERTVQGTGNKSGTVDSTLERLRTEAAKSGDFTKVVQYKKSKQAAK